MWNAKAAVLFGEFRWKTDFLTKNILTTTKLKDLPRGLIQEHHLEIPLALLTTLNLHQDFQTLLLNDEKRLFDGNLHQHTKIMDGHPSNFSVPILGVLTILRFVLKRNKNKILETGPT